MAAALILAHQGGWDETLLVLAPLVLIGVLLKVANRRAKRLLAEQRAAVDGTGAAGDEHTSRAGDVPPATSPEG